MTKSLEHFIRRRKIFRDTINTHRIDRCVIMTGSFRSGTSFIANLLAANGLPSLRSEKFAPLDNFSNDSDDSNISACFTDIFSTATSGLFVSKIMWPHRNSLARILGYQRADSAQIAEIFPNSRWINVSRKDKIDQAISFWKAKETNQWGRTQSNEVATDPDYDFKKIHRCFAELSAHDILWRDFHELARTQVYHLQYEEFLQDVPAHLSAILDWLHDHRLPTNSVKAETSLRIQRNLHSQNTKERFLQELYDSGF